MFSASARGPGVKKINRETVLVGNSASFPMISMAWDR